MRPSSLFGAGADGNLYGATIWGGQFGYGVIFAMTTDGAYSVLYSFAAKAGDGDFYQLSSAEARLRELRLIDAERRKEQRLQ